MKELIVKILLLVIHVITRGYICSLIGDYVSGSVNILVVLFFGIVITGLVSTIAFHFVRFAEFLNSIIK
jgi:hypothetical protein